MYQEKTVKVNKKAKLKSLKQIVDICLKRGIEFNFLGKDGLEIDLGYDTTTFTSKHFGKDFLIKSAELSFSDGKIDDVTYYTNKMTLHGDLSLFFTGFPKLSKKDKTAPIPPPEPKIIVSLAAGKGHSNYDMNFLDNGVLKVGCNEFTLKQIKTIHEFLGDCLDKSNI